MLQNGHIVEARGPRSKARFPILGLGVEVCHCNDEDIVPIYDIDKLIRKAAKPETSYAVAQWVPSIRILCDGPACRFHFV